ncbi:esterase-like activity of phytase-domain-containing protein [Chaetomium sp. MPI-SDFR-AT-0129]|nr:esterase-like activity of phytase-domain-containing protein [Chaetomium sp. MPI-SDFR-AT-0129]
MVLIKYLALAGLTTHAAAKAITTKRSPASSVSCNGQSYTYQELAGYGSVASDARDSFGDTISIGSSMSIKNWSRSGDSYTGTLYGLPDRGWNTNGTQNTVPRVHIFDIQFTPAPDATKDKPSGPNLQFEYKSTILLSGPDGKPMTGLDPDFTGGLKFDGFPTLPASTYPGDGFGESGAGDKRISLDAEGLVILDDGFWISDEYGPFVYKFDNDGKMVAAIQPPDAILPIRNGEVSFNSNTPPIYDPNQIPDPEDPTHGRQNNQGFEGLTISPDGKSLYVMLQSAAEQDGGNKGSKKRNTRLLQYSIDGNGATYKAEYVVPLPKYDSHDGKTKVAAQSEIHYISETQLLVLARDSGSGRGQTEAKSIYRQVDVVDFSDATDIKGDKFDNIQNGNITEGGFENPSDDLVSGITPAELCSFLDFNDNDELNKFTTAEGDVIHNGSPVDLGLLNEKWESLALVPVNVADSSSKKRTKCQIRDDDDEYYLFTLSDNDFITNNGYADFGKIQFVDNTATVPFLNSQALVFKVTLPKGGKPLVA